MSSSAPTIAAVASLADIERAVGSWCEATDPATHMGADAVAAVERLSRVIRRLTAKQAGFAERVDACRAHPRQAGSADAWLARQNGTSQGDAKKAIDTARRLKGCPATADAFAKGELSLGEADVISGAAAVDPSAEAELVAKATRSHDLADTKERAAKVKAAARKGEDPEARRRRLRGRRRWSEFTEDEMAAVGARWLPEEFAVVSPVIDAYAVPIFERARRAGVRDSFEAYRSDAVLAALAAAGELLGLDHGSKPKRAATAPVASGTPTPTGASTGTAATDAESTKTAATDVASSGMAVTDAESTGAAATDAESTGTAATDAASTGPAATDLESSGPAATDAASSGMAATDVASSGTAATDAESVDTTGPQTAAPAAESSATAPESSATTDQTESEPEAESELDALLKVRPGRVRLNVSVLVDGIALKRGYATASETCEIVGVGPVDVAWVSRILPESIVDVLVHDLVDIRAHATMTRHRKKAVDKALRARDRRCVVPGCRRKGRLQADHRHDFAKGGPTSGANLELLCEVHHYEKTHCNARLERTDTEWLWYPPPPKPGEPEPPPGSIPWRAPIGEHLTAFDLADLPDDPPGELEPGELEPDDEPDEREPDDTLPFG